MYIYNDLSETKTKKKKQERKGKAEFLEKKPAYKQFLYGFLNLIRFDYRI